MRRAGAILLLCSGLLLLPLAAQAKHGCRERARDLNAVILDQVEVGIATAETVERAFFDALSDAPECQNEFQSLAAWYAAKNEGQSPPFPFAKSDDPRHGFLGPVGAWWNIVRFDILDGSWTLFWLFGWELFLTPIIPATAFGLAIIGSLFGLGRPGRPFGS